MKNFEVIRTREVNKLLKDNPRLNHQVLEGEEKLHALNNSLINKGKLYGIFAEYTTLLDIEELVKCIVSHKKVNWEEFWVNAKIMRAKHNIGNTISEYEQDPNIQKLMFIQSAIFQELKKLKIDYVKFIKDRVSKRSRRGGFNTGHSIIKQDENELTR